MGVACGFYVHGTCHFHFSEFAGLCHFDQFDIVCRIGEFRIDFFCEMDQCHFRLFNAEFAACGKIIFNDRSALFESGIGDYRYIGKKQQFSIAGQLCRRQVCQ